MNQAEFDVEVKHAIAAIERLLEVKGGEYAGSEDRLANFKRGAALTGATPLQVLFIYMSKHYDAVATYVRDEAEGTSRPRSESIEGRLHDIINYAILALAMVKEQREVAHRTKLRDTVDDLAHSSVVQNSGVGFGNQGSPTVGPVFAHWGTGVPHNMGDHP